MNDAFGRPQLGSGPGRHVGHRAGPGPRAHRRRMLRRSCWPAATPTGLAAAAAEAKEAGAEFVATVAFDANDVDQAAAVVDSGFSAIGRVDLVVIAVGLLCDDEADERDPARVARCVTVNFTWPAAALSRVAHHLREQGSGQAVVLSSVAGVRVRRSNYVYGSAKAGLDAYARTLNQTLAGSGATVAGRPPRVRPIEDDRGSTGPATGDDARGGGSGHREGTRRRGRGGVVAAQAPRGLLRARSLARTDLAAPADVIGRPTVASADRGAAAQPLVLSNRASQHFKRRPPPHPGGAQRP